MNAEPPLPRRTHLWIRAFLRARRDFARSRNTTVNELLGSTNLSQCDYYSSTYVTYPFVYFMTWHKYDAATEIFEAAKRASNLPSGFWRASGIAYGMTGDRVRSIEAYRRAVANASAETAAELHAALSEQLELNEDTDAAVEHNELAIGLIENVMAASTLWSRFVRLTKGLPSRSKQLSNLLNRRKHLAASAN